MKENRMSIASELEAYATPTGVQCRVEKLLLGHGSEHHDLMEALASSATHSAVARWWNATRAEKTGALMSDNIVSRHRAKGCLRCR